MAFVAFNSLFLIIFVLSALVQYNDVDVFFWLTIYLSAAGMCAAAFRDNPAVHWLPPFVFAVSLIWMISLVQGMVGVASMSEIAASLGMQSNAVEEAREVGGLAVVNLWAACLIYRQRRRLREQS